MVTVKVSELLKMAQELTNDGIDYVEVEEFKADLDDNSPACLHFGAYDGFGGCIDYEEIEHIDVSFDYKAEMEL